MKPSNPTSRDIAEAAGVSQATVSRALRDSPLVRKETREHIQRIARELNYTVNRNAAGLRSQSSNTIAVLMFNEADNDTSEPLINPFFLSMLGHLTQSASAHGYDVLVSLQELSSDWQNDYQASNRADGLILLGYGDYEKYRLKLAALAETNTRYVIWGAIAADSPGHAFGCDNENGGYRAARHLAGLGCKAIAFIGDASGHNPEFAARHRGYRRAIDEAGLPYRGDLIAGATNSEHRGFRCAHELLDRGLDFDAIFAATDLLAIGAMRALRERGLRIPEDVRVVGFDDIDLAAFVKPALTTVRQNTREAAEGLVNRIVRLIEGQAVDSTLMEPVLVVRESCGSTPND